MSSTIKTFNAIYKTKIGKQLTDRVFDPKLNWGASADIDSTCLYMGNGIYEALAKIIPKGRVIYDFGASYGFQSWHFRNHKRYIAIQPEYSNSDMPDKEKFRTDNSIWFFGTIKQFFEQFELEKDSFAICNAVPSAEVELVRKNCPYLYVNYPEWCDSDFKKDDGGK